MNPRGQHDSLSFKILEFESLEASMEKVNWHQAGGPQATMDSKLTSRPAALGLILSFGITKNLSLLTLPRD